MSLLFHPVLLFLQSGKQNSVITNLLQFFFIKEESPFFKDYKRNRILPPNGPPFRKERWFSKAPRLRPSVRLLRAECQQVEG